MFVIDDERCVLECGRYIERNPLKACIAKNPEDYVHSSFRSYIGLESFDLADLSPAFLALDDRERKPRRPSNSNWSNLSLFEHFGPA